MASVNRWEERLEILEVNSQIDQISLSVVR